MNQYYNSHTPYGYPPSPQQMEPYRRPLRKWSNYICGALILLQVFPFVLYMPVRYLDHWEPFLMLSQPIQDLVHQSLELAVYVLIFWLPTLMLVSWIKIPPSVSFPLAKPKASMVIPAVFLCLGASVLGMTMAGIIAMIMETIFGLTPTMPDMSSPVGLGANVVYVFSMTFAPAIFEELLFRGAIMQSLRRFGDGFALVVSAILFGLIHGNLIQGPNAVLLGLVIGYFVLRTGSLITGMIIHLVNNGLSVLCGYLVEHFLAPERWDTAYMSLYGIYAICGGAALVYLLVKHPGLFRVAPSNYPLPTSKKNSAFFTTAASIVFLIMTLILIISQFERVSL